MTNEFKKIKNNSETRYVLETATSGATSAGAVATAPGKKREDSILAQEAGKEKDAPKPRNFVAKNAKMGGAGKMKDKSKTIPRKEKHKKPVAEGFNGEYDDEAGMAHSNLLSTARAVMGLLKTIKDRDNLPEWGQEKIAKAEMMLVSVWDYLQSQKQMGNDPQVEGLGRMRGSSSAYDRDYASSVSGMGRGSDHRGLGQELAHETNNYAVAIDGRTWKVFADQRQAENIARSLKAKGKNATVHPTGENPSESVAEGERTMSRAAKGNEKYGKDGMKALAKAGREGASEKKLDAIRDKHDNYNEDSDPCWSSHKMVGTKKKGGKTVPNCVPKESSVAEVAPPGWEKTVKAMKKHKDIDNPFALAWSMKNKGYKSHKKESADPYFESLKAKVEELAKK